MFKVGDKVFDNERGYGEGVVEQIDKHGEIFVRFKDRVKIESYCKEGRWFITEPITLFKKEEKMNFYYVGQKVSHQGFGNGVVSSTDNSIQDYPIMVDFKEYSRSFTVDGRYGKDQEPSLSQKPHVPLELEEVVSFEKGELVWVKFALHNSDWCARYYSHFDGSKYYVFNNQKKEGYTSLVKAIRKFSDNPLI